ncbi:MAG: TonB-dependent receptor, partial [Bacteroidetes bacterium]|nr:TonB-dependent receptor [Fibrella sp.]
MKNFCLIVLLLPASLAVRAQTGSVVPPADSTFALKGSVADSTAGKPVAFATVALLTSDGKIKDGATTDESGGFAFAKVVAGTYKLTVSFVGYRPKTTAPVVVKARDSTNSVVDVGRILITTDAKTLAQVDVVAQKALMEDKGDRLVYNAEKDISNAGGTAADVLRKVPMLTVDISGNVQMRGSSNIKVLINGKPSAMMARNLADALRQMPANTIKSIEVITSPGAKYDAEGSAGVINIITKKALQGFNGSVTAAAADFDRPYRSLGTNLNLRKKKFGAALSLNTNQFGQISRSETSRTTLVDGRPVNSFLQESSSANTSTVGNGELSLDYDIDTTNRLNAAATGWGGDFPSNSVTMNRLLAPDGTLLQEFRNDIRFRNPYGNSQVDLGYTRTLAQKKDVDGRGEFSVLTQYSRMPDNYFYDTDRYGSSSPT